MRKSAVLLVFVFLLLLAACGSPQALPAAEDGFNTAVAISYNSCMGKGGGTVLA